MKLPDFTNRAKRLATQAKSYAADHPEMIDKVVTKAGNVADSGTGRKHSAKIKAAQEKIKKAL